MTLTTPNGFKIGPSTEEIRGVSKVPLAMNNPVDSFFRRNRDTMAADSEGGSLRFTVK